MDNPVVAINAGRSHKKDFPAYTYKRRENNLVARVEQARERGLSYGAYMALLHEGRIEDPLKEP